MKWKRSAVLAGLSIALLSTSACGGTTEKEGQASSSPAGTAASPAASSPPVEIKLMANFPSAEQTASDKKFIAEIEAKNNVKLTFEVPPSTGYKERLQLMLASGTYPDAIMFLESADQSFQNAVKEGIVIPVNEYIKDKKNLQEFTYPASWDQLRINQDDKIYGIPRTSVVRNDAYMVRKDWLDNIGFKVPDNFEITIEQFEEILTKFTNNDPDKNGKKDTYGYGGAYNAQKALDPIIPGAFGLTGWQKASGGEYGFMNPMYDKNSTAYKEALEFSARMYKSGFFDPDSATNDAAKQRERFVKGVTGIFPYFAGYITGVRNDTRKNFPNSEVTYLYVKNKNGVVQNGSLGASSTGLWGFWAISSTSKNPQKVAEVLDSWISDDMWQKTAYGFEGVDYQMKDGVAVVMDPAPTPAQFRRSTMRRAYDTNFFVGITWTKEEKAEIVPWIEKSIETVVPALDNAFVPDAAKKPNYMDYDKVWQQTIMKIIMGDEPVTKFDSLLDGWYKNGGTDYVKQMNDYIKKMQSSK
ncbi:MAG: hypothetical protein K0R57_2075 [Paenibacillaceae bacterium]|jgi:putative aldouronate transport system substrate-binding protein|nr:hypothetical protein [Paenibacillaceae bacterium]